MAKTEFHERKTRACYVEIQKYTVQFRKIVRGLYDILSGRIQILSSQPVTDSHIKMYIYICIYTTIRKIYRKNNLLGRIFQCQVSSQLT